MRPEEFASEKSFRPEQSRSQMGACNGTQSGHMLRYMLKNMLKYIQSEGIERNYQITVFSGLYNGTASRSVLRLELLSPELCHEVRKHQVGTIRIVTSCKLAAKHRDFSERQTMVMVRFQRFRDLSALPKTEPPPHQMDCKINCGLRNTRKHSKINHLHTFLRKE